MAIRILIGYDGSTGADDAVRAAARLFPGAAATVLYVPDALSPQEHLALARIAVPDDVLVTAAANYERDVRSHARECAESGRHLAERLGLKATAEVRIGPSAWRELDRTAHELDVDVIVCGTRGQRGISRALLGSTSSSLLHHADRAVLVVPPGSGEPSEPAMVGYDGSHGARDAIAAAARLLRGRPAVVAHAWASPLERSYAGEQLAATSPPDGDLLTHELAEVIALRGMELAEEGATLARDAGLEVSALAVPAPAGAWRALLAAARAEDAGVIVVGCRGRGALTATVLGSVSSGLAHHADRPLLVVR